MDKYIICNYYRAKNSLRQSENIFCLQKNLNLSFIKKIFVFCDFKVKKDLIKLKNNKKIVYINTGERNPYLKEVLNFCGKKILPRHENKKVSLAVAPRKNQYISTT